MQRLGTRRLLGRVSRGDVEVAHSEERATAPTGRRQLEIAKDSSRSRREITMRRASPPGRREPPWAKTKR
jgi:hypothetical protein